MQLFRVNQLARFSVTFAWHVNSSLEGQSWISIPMLRAVPMMILDAASSLAALRSFIFIFTMSNTCFRVTLPTFSLFGVLDPEAIPAAFFNNAEAGGDFVMKVKDLSWKTVITTGMTIPACSLVAALNSLQKAMMFTPC